MIGIDYCAANNPQWLPEKSCDSIDTPAVKELVFEGGQEAF
jgi:hypothetical protein